MTSNRGTLFSMRRFFYLLSIAIYTAAVFMAGMLVVQLYALYVLVYTGAVFMIGVYMGERLERDLASKTTVAAANEAGSELAAVRETDELTIKPG